MDETYIGGKEKNKLGRRRYEAERKGRRRGIGREVEMHVRGGEAAEAVDGLALAAGQRHADRPVVRIDADMGIDQLYTDSAEAWRPWRAYAVMGLWQSLGDKP